MYSNIAILPIGFLLNLLCIITFIKSKTYKSPTGLHLVFIAVADNVILLSMFLGRSETWYKYINIPDMYNKKGVFNCQESDYIVVAGFLWSGLLLASATIERFLSVAFPLKVQQWNMYAKTKVLMGAYVLVAFGLSSYALLCVELKPATSNTSETCVIAEQYNDVCFLSDVIIIVAFSNSLCSLLILTFTILISFYLFKLRRVRIEMGKTSAKEFQITLMLVMVALFFMVLRIPEMVLFEITYYNDINGIINSLSEKMLFVHQVLLVCVALNHSVNFLIYVKFLRSFRHTFVSMVTCYKCRKKSTQGGTTLAQKTSISEISSSQVHMGNIQEQ